MDEISGSAQVSRSPDKRFGSWRRSGQPTVSITPHVPEEIRDRISWEPRTPVPLIRPLATKPAPPRAGRPKHKLVVLGDSLSQGFRSLAIHETSLSWPALVAKYGGIKDFRFPVFKGPPDCPGLPLNLDKLLTEVTWPGSALDLAADAALLARLHRILTRVEDYWERGEGNDQVRRAPGRSGRDLDRVNHNLACWGYDLRDSFALTVGGLEQRIDLAPGRDRAALAGLPSAALERSALITLAGGRQDDTAVSLAGALGADGGIETLIVALGSNNILGTVLDFSLRWTDEAGATGQQFDRVDHKDEFNAWAPDHFRSEYDLLMTEVADIQAQHVIVLTVPHVTIVPLARGVGSRMTADRYFARYTKPWFSDADFSPNRHPCLSGEQMRIIDFAIDLYNDHIVKTVDRVNAGLVASGRSARFHVLDIAGVLDRLAYRRYLVDDEAQPAWWTLYDLPQEYLDMSPVPDTRYFDADRFGRSQGGLIGLDGVHPTTIGYAIIAREVMNLMTNLGVPLESTEPDYADVIAQDGLNHSPLLNLDSVMSGVGMINKAVDLAQVFRHRTAI